MVLQGVDLIKKAMTVASTKFKKSQKHYKHEVWQHHALSNTVADVLTSPWQVEMTSVDRESTQPGYNPPQV